jgi:diadenosine tetraphosphate (Ap4A) HIT family hydrolase
MSAEFHLHERLAADTLALDRWPLCEVLLARDATYPWLILVPRRVGLRDFDDLAPEDLDTASREIVRASRALKAVFRPEKLNVAALGNQVPQLHVHVIARFTDDPAWPGPIWGVVPPRDYEAIALEARFAELREAFSHDATGHHSAGPPTG